MAGDEYEPNRVLGFPRTRDPKAPRRDKEPQRVMGFPVDWLSDIDLSRLRSLAHPVRRYQRWLRRRRLDPYESDDDLQQFVLAAPVLGAAALAGQGGLPVLVAGERLGDRRVEREHAVEPGQPQDRQDPVGGGHEGERSVLLA